MRVLALLATLIVSTASQAGEATTAWTTSEATQVTSGPGEAYYATAILPAGSPVRVLGDAGDGWLAITPPEASFSVVNVTDIDSTTPGVGRINRSGTRSRIGSVLHDRHDAVHVTLAEGAEVKLLGADTNDKNWMRIAPPQGEYRYVRSRDVAPTQPTTTAIGATTDWRSRSAAVETVTPTAGELPSAGTDPLQNLTITTDPLPQQGEVGLPSATTAPPAVPATTIEAPPQPTAEAHLADTPTAPATTNQSSEQTTTSVPMQQAIDQLEFTLARRVSEPMNVWMLEDLERQTAKLLTQATDQTERTSLLDLAQRLDRFAKLQKKYIATRSSTVANVSPPVPSGVAPPQRLPTTGEQITPITPLEVGDQVTPSPETNQPGYDAIGVLRPVVSRRAGAPPYALVDDQGRIVTFITPSPSLNVQPLLGKRVGVSGTRGFMPEYQQRHVATARIQTVPRGDLPGNTNRR